MVTACKNLYQNTPKDRRGEELSAAKHSTQWKPGFVIWTMQEPPIMLTSAGACGGTGEERFG
jgi:hypothetical protein